MTQPFSCDVGSPRHWKYAPLPTHFGLEWIDEIELGGRCCDQDRGHRRESQLQPNYSGQRQHPLKNRGQADQHYEQFEKACQTTLINKLVDGPKTNCADDANNQNPD
jgi:hypothetical protein